MRTIAMVFLVACGGNAEGDGTPPPPTEPHLGDYQRDCDDVTDCVLVEVPESDPCSGCGGYWAALRSSDAAAYQAAADAFEDASECLDGPQAGRCELGERRDLGLPARDRADHGFGAQAGAGVQPSCSG